MASMQDPSCPTFSLECFRMEKVYDYCYQIDTEELCYPFPSSSAPTFVSCTPFTSACTFLSATTPDAITGLINANFKVTSGVTIVVITGTPTFQATFTITKDLYKTVTLCGPTGTYQVCEISSVACGPVSITSGVAAGSWNVCVDLSMCQVFESLAKVKVFMPDYGPCEPAVCPPPPGLICPPVVPPQCPPNGY